MKIFRQEFENKFEKKRIGKRIERKMEKNEKKLGKMKKNQLGIEKSYRLKSLIAGDLRLLALFSKSLFP